MRYLLDTNTCIVYLKGRNLGLKRRIESLAIAEIVVCAVVKAELIYGAMKSADPSGNFSLQQGFVRQFDSLPFDDFAAMTFGTMRATLENQGTPIGPYDLQIAAIALAHDLTLVTHNVREFARVEGLRVEDWEVAIGGQAS
jgi:tRNA(fMet)-specific endonuclease VapC